MNKKVKVGSKVRVLKNGALIPVGTISKVAKLNSAGNVVLNCSANSVFPSEYELIAETKEDIEKYILELESEITTERDKLQFMSENGFEEYDENEFKVFQTLKTLDNSKLNIVEKAKLIAELINK